MSSPTRSILSTAILACCSAALGIASRAACAQEAPRSSAGSPIDEITVVAEKLRSKSLADQNATASRLGISALDTPATVQVITGDSIRLRGDSDIGAAVTRAVGFTSSTTSGGSGYGVTARGFGSSSVTSLYDGMKSLINIGSQSYPYDTWNVERIEVLNGPASVLHGNGAIGGAINIIPRKPSSDGERIVMLSVGRSPRSVPGWTWPARSVTRSRIAWTSAAGRRMAQSRSGRRTGRQSLRPLLMK
jgi:iron complex outermembrane receptor protein